MTTKKIELNNSSLESIFRGVSAPRLIKCPGCKKSGDWLSTPFGPFCSKRCKLIDLGKWFSEENVISEPLRPEHFAQFEELPPEKNPDEGE